MHFTPKELEELEKKYEEESLALYIEAPEWFGAMAKELKRLWDVEEQADKPCQVCEANH